MIPTRALIEIEVLRHASEEDRPGEILVRLPNNEVAFIRGDALVHDFETPPVKTAIAKA